MDPKVTVSGKAQEPLLAQNEDDDNSRITLIQNIACVWPD